MEVLPDADVHFLLDASSWAGAHERDREELRRCVAERASAAAHAAKGGTYARACAADVSLRDAYARLLQATCVGAGMSGATMSDTNLLTFIANLVCTGKDAGVDERSLAKRTAAQAVYGIREHIAGGRGNAVSVALAVLSGMRKSLAGRDGLLTYENVLCFHRAVGVIFAPGDVVANVRRARLVVMLMGAEHFEPVWDGLLAYERDSAANYGR